MGGAAGHMAHLHENTWLTFGEIKSFLTQVASAEISPIEKVDGQNVFFRWTPSGIMCARNAGHLKRGGIDEGEYRAMWDGHPAEGAFINGFEKIKDALNGLSDSAKKAFETSQPGTYRFCNCEIMYPENENLIMYDGNYVVLHNLKEYALVGSKLRETEVFMSGSPEFDAIVQSMSDVEKKADAKEWQIFGPQVVELNNIADGGILESAHADLTAIGYSDDTVLFKLVEDKLRPILVAADIPPDKINLILNRIKLISEGAETSELPSANSIKQGLSREQKSALKDYISVAKAKNFIGVATAPVAKAISDFAIEVLRGLESFFVTDSEAEVERIKSTLSDSIAALENYEGENAEQYGELLEKQLEKLGPIENIASTMEGIIFEYPPGSKNLVKLTGSFAMANQIIGRAKRMPRSEQPEEPINAGKSVYTFDEMENLYEAIADNQTSSNSVAIIGGAFKPPHLGHVAMVYHYLDLADEVKIYISDPQSPKSQRFCGNTCLTADMSLSLWQLLLGPVAGVTVEVSSAPSPITIAYDSVMPNTTPFAPGTTVYLGASDKGGDYNRFKGALKKADPSLNVQDPEVYAAPAAELPAEYVQKLEASGLMSNMPSFKKGLDPKDYSASDLRYLLELASTSGPKSSTARDLAGYFVGPRNINAYMAAIGLVSETKKYSLVSRIYG